MDVRWYFVVLLVAALAQSSVAQTSSGTVCTSATADLAVVVDASGSIRWNGPQNWPDMLNFVKTIIDEVSLGENSVRMAMLVFSDTVVQQFLLNFSYDKATLKAKVDETVYLDKKTNTAEAIRVLRETVFQPSNGDRPGVDNIGIIITDGRSTSETGEALRQATLAKAAGIRMVTIGVTTEIDRAELEGIATKPIADNFFEVTSFDKLITLLDKLVLEISCQTQPPPTPTPTLPPPTGCTNQADFVLLMDSSGSINSQRFIQVRDFTKLMVEQLDVDSGKVRVGLVQYSTQVNSIFQLNRYTKRSEMLTAIDQITYNGGTTNTADAIRYARDIAFRTGNRSGVRKVLVIMTDGGSNDPEATLQQAFTAKTQNDITIITLAIGNWVNDFEVDNLASFPYQSNRLKVSSFNNLDINVARTLRNAICNSQNECSTNPCRNNGQCVDSVNTYYCVCQSGWAGRDCSTTCRQSADIVFNLDTSGSIGQTNYQNTMSFVANVMNAFPITSMARVGFTTYASQVQRFFNLNQMTTKERYMNALGLAYNGGTTNTAGDIKETYEQMFTSQNGDRTNIRNVAVTVTDGRSNDPAETWRQAIQARQRNIHMVAVGVSQGQDKKELLSIASYPAATNLLSVANSRDLNSVTNNLLALVCNNVNECSNRPCNTGECIDGIGGYTCRCPTTATGTNCERKCGGGADVVFLIDSSGSIHHERFDTVLNFLIGIVDKLEVGSDRTRVGAVRFADSASSQFNLKDYSTKQDVQHALRRIAYTGGRTNIADGLRMAREQLFTAGNGDRNGVPNFLIVFTDGESNVQADQTMFQAIEARVAGIQIISVGVGLNPRMSELVGIASMPTNEMVFTSPRFNGLTSIIDNVVKATCDDVNECTNNPCQFGSRCINGLKRYICICERPRTGQNCERTCDRDMDLVIILDVSGSVETAYTITQSFAQRLAYGLPVRGNRANVGLITYSDVASTRFKLDKYAGNDQAVINAMVIPFAGGRTNTYAALDMANRDFFVGNGDRNGVANKIVLVTDGNTNMEVARASTEASNLRNKGVEIFVVGVGSPNTANINDYATNPDNTHTFNIATQNDVNTVATNVLNRLCQ